jgi:hypothetical protein
VSMKETKLEKPLCPACRMPVAPDVVRCPHCRVDTSIPQEDLLKAARAIIFGLSAGLDVAQARKVMALVEFVAKHPDKADEAETELAKIAPLLGRAFQEKLPSTVDKPSAFNLLGAIIGSLLFGAGLAIAAVLVPGDQWASTAASTLLADGFGRLVDLVADRHSDAPADHLRAARSVQAFAVDEHFWAELERTMLHAYHVNLVLGRDTLDARLAEHKQLKRARIAAENTSDPLKGASPLGKLYMLTLARGKLERDRRDAQAKVRQADAAFAAHKEAYGSAKTMEATRKELKSETGRAKARDQELRGQLLALERVLDPPAIERGLGQGKQDLGLRPRGLDLT